MAIRPTEDRGQASHRTRDGRWRIRRKSVASRIAVLILVPTLFLSGLVAYGVYLTARDTLAVSLLARVESAVHLETGKLLDALQEERRASMVYLGSDQSSAAGEALRGSRQETDRAASALRRIVDEDVLSDVNPSERQWLVEMQARLTTLKSLREDVDTGGPAVPAWRPG